MSAQQLRVLIVDDQRIICDLLRRELEETCAVETAIGGAEAVARIETGRRYAMIFVDLMMPDVSGYDVIAAIKRKTPEMLPRVVVMTGGPPDPTRMAAIGVTDARVLYKPFGSAELQVVVSEYLPDAGGDGRGRW